MIKYLKINWILFKNSYIRDSKIVGFRFSVMLFQMTDILVAVFFFDILFAHTTNLGNWNFYQVLFLYAFSKGILAFHSAWTRKGIESLSSQLIRTGEFDFYLTKPVDPMWLVSISKPRIFDFIAMSFNIALMIYAAVKGGFALGAGNIIWFIFLTFVGLVLYYFLKVLTIIPTFWLVRLFSLRDIMYRLSQFMRYPAGVFPPFLKTVFFVFFPVMVATYIPVRTLLYPPDFKYILYMIFITIAFGFITRFFWNLGQRSYSSASS